MNDRLTAVKLQAALYGARTVVITHAEEAGKMTELPAWREYVSSDYDWAVGGGGIKSLAFAHGHLPLDLVEDKTFADEALIKTLFSVSGELQPMPNREDEVAFLREHKEDHPDDDENVVLGFARGLRVLKNYVRHASC